MSKEKGKKARKPPVCSGCFTTGHRRNSPSCPLNHSASSSSSSTSAPFGITIKRKSSSSSSSSSSSKSKKPKQGPKKKTVDVEADASVLDYRTPDWRDLNASGATFIPVHTRDEVFVEGRRMHQSTPPAPNDFSAAAFSEAYLPASLMQTWADNSESYRTNKAPQQYRINHRKIQIADIYYFIAITMYMGVVRLPSVKSYWKGVDKDNMYPVHKPCRHLSHPRYQMLWRCISLIPVDPEFLDSDTDDDENEEENEEENEQEQEDEAMEEDELEDNNALVGRCFFDPDDPDDVYLRIETVTDNTIVLILSTATGEPADAAGFDIDFVRAHLVSKRDQVAREMEIEREKARYVYFFC